MTISEMIDAARSEGKQLESFDQDEFGQFHADAVSITLYKVCGDWEIDVKLKCGIAIGGDIPCGKLAFGKEGTLHGTL